MVWGGWWEGGSCLGTHVHPWWLHVNVWQNQYSIVKQNKVKIKIKKKKESKRKAQRIVDSITKWLKDSNRQFSKQDIKLNSKH